MVGMGDTLRTVYGRMASTFLSAFVELQLMTQCCSRMEGEKKSQNPKQSLKTEKQESGLWQPRKQVPYSVCNNIPGVNLLRNMSLILWVLVFLRCLTKPNCEP